MKKMSFEHEEGENAFNQRIVDGKQDEKELFNEISDRNA